MSTGAGNRSIITGVSTDAGFETALRLVEAEHELILGAASIDHGWRSRARLLEHRPNATIQVLPLDLRSLASVREFAATVSDRYQSWNALFNLETAEHPGSRTLTEDRFELHFGVNHLAHFALTGLLLPLAAPTARVISSTTLSARSATIRFHDLRWDHGYRAHRAEAASMRAKLLFALSLQQRFASEAGAQRSIAVHTGVGSTAGAAGSALRRTASTLLGQDAASAAEAFMFALRTEEQPEHSWVGPGKRLQTAGTAQWHPLPEALPRKLEAERLWRLSGQLTRVPW